MSDKDSGFHQMTNFSLNLQSNNLVHTNPRAQMAINSADYEEVLRVELGLGLE
jgi:hypothetical protein